MPHPRLPAVLLLTTLAATLHAAAPLPHQVMPAPAELRGNDGRLAITARFSVFVAGHHDARLQDGIARALRRWEARTGLVFPRAPATNTGAAALVVACAAAGNALPVLGEDESYTLDVTPARATLRAPAVVGALRGLETLLQLLASDADGFFVPAVTVRDAPRFPWRGLLVDVCRHWQPMAVIQRTLDGMALAKLNVLHLHLTEDQGFRIESKLHPRLHTFGSDGQFFTQDEIREIIAYAAARGIRVVPEFDIPGHATSWLVGHPELASRPAAYTIERHWGIFDPALDPTNEAVYTMLDAFLGEMAALFPDPYVHIGGDENNGKHWDANPRIQAFKREHHLADNAALQAHFNRRVLAILTRHGKHMIGWDEIFHPDLPKDAVIHSWRGPDSLATAARQGYTGILSNGYYIDLSFPASAHYLNDPLPDGTTLTPEEQRRVLGGEATMWSEWVTPETIDSRIWPRTAAIAERLWSPRDVRDIDDMYRRLALVSFRLEELGLALTSHVDAMLRRFAGDRAESWQISQLRNIADLVEPVKEYRRGREQPGTTQFHPLTTFVDCARPDSASAREFARLVRNHVLHGPAPTGPREPIEAHLVFWRNDARALLEDAANLSPRVHALAPLLHRVIAACDVGIEALSMLGGHGTRGRDWLAASLDKLSQAAEPHDACELPIIPALRLLVAAAASSAEHATMPPEQWRAHVEQLAAPPAPAPAAPAH